MGIKISKDHLHPSVIESITSLIGDLNQLETTAKGNAVEAINELLANGGNKEELEALIAEIAEGKELIANAVGEPLTAEESFDEMSNDINSLLSTFKANMMNNGITVESSDKFKSLIDKIATMVEEGSGKGIQFAEGTFPKLNDLTTEKTVTYDLDFTPTMLFVVFNSITNNSAGIVYKFCISNIDTISLPAPGYSDAARAVKISLTNITNESFTILDSSYYTTKDTGGGKWYAIGVGEEDTTLRDSLASILENKGVSVTEEDDMSSLITKVENVKPSLNVKAGDSIELYSKVTEQSDKGFAIGPFNNSETHYLNIHGSVKFFIRMYVNSTEMYVNVKLVDQTKTNVKFEQKLTNSTAKSFYEHTLTIENIENTDYLIFEYYSSNVTNGIVITSFKITADLV